MDTITPTVLTNAIVLFLATFLIWIMYLGVGVLWIIDGRIKKEVALHALVSSFFAWGLAEASKNIFNTARPYIENGKQILTLTQPMDGAFPSSHSAASFAMAVAIFLHNKKIGVVFLILALLIGSSRVVANVHYPIDILGGALIGSLVSFIFERLHVFRLIESKKK